MNQKLLWTVLVLTIIGWIVFAADQFIIGPSDNEGAVLSARSKTAIKPGSRVAVSSGAKFYSGASLKSKILKINGGSDCLVKAGPTRSFFPTTSLYKVECNAQGLLSKSVGWVEARNIATAPLPVVQARQLLIQDNSPDQAILRPAFTKGNLTPLLVDDLVKTVTVPPITVINLDKPLNIDTTDYIADYCPIEQEWEEEWQCDSYITGDLVVSPTDETPINVAPVNRLAITQKTPVAPLCNSKIKPAWAKNCNCARTLKTPKHNATHYNGPGPDTANGEPFKIDALRGAVSLCEYLQYRNKCVKITIVGAPGCVGDSITIKINDNGPDVPNGGVDLPTDTMKDLVKNCVPPIPLTSNPPSGTVQITREIVDPCPAGI